MNNAVFENAMENVSKHREIKLVTKSYLSSKPNYYTTKLFTENLLAKEMIKIEILMNKPE